jgi:CRISPR-associated protein Csd2
MNKKATTAHQFTVTNRINVVGTIDVEMANANGDPMYKNQPRRTTDDFGIMSDMCQKYKLRRRIVELAAGKSGYELFYCDDGTTLDEKVSAFNSAAGIDVEGLCAKYIDLRAFGAVLIGDRVSDNDADGDVEPTTTVKPKRGDKAPAPTKKPRRTNSVTGCVTITLAKSMEPINIVDLQITRCCDQKEKEKKQMGTKAVVEKATYTFFATVNARMAKKNGFSDADFAIMLESIKTMFVGDESAARPAGSMDVGSLFVVQHSTIDGDESDKRIKARLNRVADGTIEFDMSGLDNAAVARIV